MKLTPGNTSSLFRFHCTWKFLSQKFRQSSGTGIDLSMFEEAELSKDGNADVYQLAVMAEAFEDAESEPEDGNAVSMSTNSQITRAIFEKDKGEFKIRVVKQILWVNSMRYELQEIYGIRNSVDNDFDGTDNGKECVVCLSEPRDATVLPCRHMCMCSGCTKVLRFQTNRCPICRQPVEQFLEIKVSKAAEEYESRQPPLYKHRSGARSLDMSLAECSNFCSKIQNS